MDAAAVPAAQWELAHPDDQPADNDVAVSGPLPESDVDGYLTVVQAADELVGLEEDLAAREQLQARIVGRLDRLVRSGRIEQLEGLTPELLLTLVHRQSGLDVWLLLTAVEVLGRMPVTWCLFREGTLSWSQVCRIVSRVRRLPVDGQRHIDRRIDASRDLLDGLGVEGLEAAVDKAARELEGPKTLERDEQRAQAESFVHVQAKLFGGIKLYGEYDDPIEAATIVNGLDVAARDAHRAAHSDADTNSETSNGDEGDGQGEPDRWNGGTRSFWQGRGLLAMCEHTLGGHHAEDHSCNSDDRGGGDVAGHVGPQRGKPTAIVHVDVADTTTTCAGQVELNVTGGGLPTISRQRLEQILSDDHDLRVVLFDGGRPLAVSDLTHADRIPTKTRIAVRARDRGCRFGSPAPPGRTHIHHIDGRRHGHHPTGSSRWVRGRTCEASTGTAGNPPRNRAAPWYGVAAPVPSPLSRGVRDCAGRLPTTAPTMATEARNQPHNHIPSHRGPTLHPRMSSGRTALSAKRVARHQARRQWPSPGAWVCAASSVSS
ncbi:MAG: HNH endonuclease [Actinobacteria bacterium]|nr:HNH endonuclease [Actinomycetota bacterium]